MKLSELLTPILENSLDCNFYSLSKLRKNPPLQGIPNPLSKITKDSPLQGLPDFAQSFDKS